VAVDSVVLVIGEIKTKSSNTRARRCCCL